MDFADLNPTFTILSSDYQNDMNGWGLAISGDGLVLAVGAENWDDDIDVSTAEGAVFIFEWNASAGWVQRDKILPPSSSYYADDFGRSVDLDATGDTLVVGAPLVSGGGGMFVFDYDSGTGTWSQRGSIMQGTGIAAGDRFGESVAVSGDGNVVACGAMYWDSATSDTGAVWVFEWSDPSWSERESQIQHTITNQSSDRLGTGVSLDADGSTLVAGASHYAISGASAQGLVVVYTWSGSAYVQQTTLQADDPGTPGSANYSNVLFGIDVWINDDADVMCVGAYDYYDWENSDTPKGGAVFIYDLISSTWTERERKYDHDANNWAFNNQYGTACQLTNDGSSVLVVARNNNIGGGTEFYSATRPT